MKQGSQSRFASVNAKIPYFAFPTLIREAFALTLLGAKPTLEEADNPVPIQIPELSQPV
jgi:hypothetical protein